MSKSNAFRISDIISNERVSFYHQEHQHARPTGIQLNPSVTNHQDLLQADGIGSSFMHGHNVDLCACVQCQTVKFIKFLNYSPMLYQYQNVHQTLIENSQGSLARESLIKREFSSSSQEKGTLFTNSYSIRFEFFQNYLFRCKYSSD
jgi:hypothetical protein